MKAQLIVARIVPNSRPFTTFPSGVERHRKSGKSATAYMTEKTTPLKAMQNVDSGLKTLSP